MKRQVNLLAFLEDLFRNVAIMSFQVRKSEEPIQMLSYNNIEEDVCKKITKEWYDHSCKVRLH